MGSKMRRPCKHTGCNKLAEPGHYYCTKHIRDEDKYKDRYLRYDKDYDKNRRWKEGARFYKSTRWQKFRLKILQRDNELCQRCLSKGKIKFAKTVHHIVEIRTPEGWARRFDADNCVTVCNKCHAEIHKTKEK